MIWLCYLGRHDWEQRVVGPHYVPYCKRCNLPGMPVEIDPIMVFSEGWEAFDKGLAEGLNPHTIPELRDEWQWGWTEAQGAHHERVAK